MARINVTKTFLPQKKDFLKYVDQIWENSQLTNQGPLLKQLERKLEDYLGVKNLHFVTNGTLALQVALEALGITEGEVITTPFSYVATTSSIMWQRCKPVFVDIERQTFCIDADKIEAAITPNTKAIMAVHVFGNPCDVVKIESIAKKHNLKVIYDAAHAFGVEYDGRSLLDYGDISICSFHATKLFHTIEGGAIIAKSKEVSEKIELIKRFGHNGDDHIMLGINAKASEFQAAMGLCNLEYVDDIIEERKKLTHIYDQNIDSRFYRPKHGPATKYNFGYYPILLASEQELLEKMDQLSKKEIFPRRYFYPSLNTLPYVKGAESCPVSEDVSSRILCLPLYNGLNEEDIKIICGVMNNEA
jgi:dTDP-4-amino-4,6-dideoxygalactose transaminase